MMDGELRAERRWRLRDLKSRGRSFDVEVVRDISQVSTTVMAQLMGELAKCAK
jgi:hypothetical protein